MVALAIQTPAERQVQPTQAAAAVVVVTSLLPQQAHQAALVLSSFDTPMLTQRPLLQLGLLP